MENEKGNVDGDILFDLEGDGAVDVVFAPPPKESTKETSNTRY